MRDSLNRPVIGVGRLLDIEGMLDTEEVEVGRSYLLVVDPEDLEGPELDASDVFTASAAGFSRKWGWTDIHYSVDILFPREMQESDARVLE